MKVSCLNTSLTADSVYLLKSFTFCRTILSLLLKHEHLICCLLYCIVASAWRVFERSRTTFSAWKCVVVTGKRYCGLSPSGLKCQKFRLILKILAWKIRKIVTHQKCCRNLFCDTNLPSSALWRIYRPKEQESMYFGKTTGSFTLVSSRNTINETQSKWRIITYLLSWILWDQA